MKRTLIPFLFLQCVGHISGAHINPAITVASVILGNKSLPIAGLYIVAQCLGGLIGYGLLKVNEYSFAYTLQKTFELCFGGHAWTENNFGVINAMPICRPYIIRDYSHDRRDCRN